MLKHVPSFHVLGAVLFALLVSFKNMSIMKYYKCFFMFFVFSVHDLFSSSFHRHVSGVFVKKICSIWGGKEEGCFSCFFQLSGSWADTGYRAGSPPIPWWLQWRNIQNHGSPQTTAFKGPALDCSGLCKLHCSRENCRKKISSPCRRGRTQTWPFSSGQRASSWEGSGLHSPLYFQSCSHILSNAW